MGKPRNELFSRHAYLNVMQGSKWQRFFLRHVRKTKTKKEKFLYLYYNFSQDSFFPSFSSVIFTLFSLSSTLIQTERNLKFESGRNSCNKGITFFSYSKKAFVLTWSDYNKYAMGYDELMPLSQRGIDGLGGLGATVVNALDTAMIKGIDEVASEARTWVEKHVMESINSKGHVNLFETTIRVLGGLLSAYHLSRKEQSNVVDSSISTRVKEANAEVLLNIAKNLVDHLLSAFTSSPTPIPFSDDVLHDRLAYPTPGRLSSISEVSTLQLEF